MDQHQRTPRHTDAERCVGVEISYGAGHPPNAALASLALVHDDGSRTCIHKARRSAEIEAHARDLQSELARTRRAPPWLIAHGKPDQWRDLDTGREITPEAVAGLIIEPASDQRPATLHAVDAGGQRLGRIAHVHPGDAYASARQHMREARHPPPSPQSEHARPFAGAASEFGRDPLYVSGRGGEDDIKVWTQAHETRKDTARAHDAQTEHHRGRQRLSRIASFAGAALGMAGGASDVLMFMLTEGITLSLLGPTLAATSALAGGAYLMVTQNRKSAMHRDYAQRIGNEAARAREQVVQSQAVESKPEHIPFLRLTQERGAGDNRRSHSEAVLRTQRDLRAEHDSQRILDAQPHRAPVQPSARSW